MKKKLSVLLLLLLNFSLFAGPGGGPGGGGGRSGPGGGRPGGGGSGNPGGSSKSPAPVSPKAPSIPAGEPKQGNAPVPNPGTPEAGPKPDNITNFRGKKMELSLKDPQVLKSSVQDAANNKKRVSLYFNQTINTQSMKPENIIVNGKPLENSTEIKFNKRVDSCSFVIETEKIDNIEITELEGYNGKKTESVKVKL